MTDQPNPRVQRRRTRARRWTIAGFGLLLVDAAWNLAIWDKNPFEMTILGGAVCCWLIAAEARGWVRGYRAAADSPARKEAGE